MWRFISGIHRGRIQCNGVIRSSPQVASRDEHCEASGVCQVQVEREVHCKNGGQGGDYHNSSWRNHAHFRRHQFHCNLRNFFDVFAVSSTIVLSCHISEYWKLCQNHARRRQQYMLCNVNEQGHQLPSASDKAFTDLKSGLAKKKALIQFAAESRLLLEFEQLCKKEEEEKRKLQAFKKFKPQRLHKKSVRFDDDEVLDDTGIEFLSDDITESYSGEKLQLESHYEELYLEFKQDWKNLCDNYDKLILTDKGSHLARQGDFKEALSLFEIAASVGCPRAGFNLGLMHEKGQGCERNVPKAMDYYQNAVENGSFEAAHNLALILLDSSNPGAHNTAVNLLEMASAGGLVGSKTELAVIYADDGQPEKAITLFEEASEENDVDAQYFLGVCYENGIGVQKDLQKAMDFYRRASQGGNAMAHYNLAHCLEHVFDGDAANLDEAKALYEKSASAEYFPADKKLKEIDRSLDPENDSNAADPGGTLRPSTSAPSMLTHLQRHLLEIDDTDWVPNSKATSENSASLRKSATYQGNLSPAVVSVMPSFEPFDVCPKAAAGKSEFPVDKADGDCYSRGAPCELVKEKTVKKDITFTLGGEEQSGVKDSENNVAAKFVGRINLDGGFGKINLSKSKVEVSKQSDVPSFSLDGDFFANFSNGLPRSESQNSLYSIQSDTSDFSIAFDENCTGFGLVPLSAMKTRVNQANVRNP